MKKIVVLGAGLSSGGAEHQCAQLMNMLAANGYRVTYASFGDVEDHYYVSPQIERIQLAPQRSTLRKLLAVEWYLLRTNAEVVIAFSQRMSVLTLFPMLFRPKVKVISSERNFTIGEPDKFENILFKTGIYHRANYIVSNNFSQGRYIANKRPSLKNKIHVITNYTDINIYKSTPLPNNGIVKIGVFSRFEEQKNFHRLIEAINKVTHKNNQKFTIAWYGNHTFPTEAQTSYFEKGLSMLRQYKLEDIFIIHDATRDVPNLIPTFDALCLPSLHEGFSNSISEYICCGRPVLCSDVSDNSVMVHEGENGFLFNPLDVNDIANAFEKYLNLSHEERDRMGRESRKIANSLFDKEKFINEYIKIIER